MFHCNNSVVTTARLDTSTTFLEGVAPGILTAKTLQGVLLSARQRSNEEHEPCDEIISPYGRMPRQVRKTRLKIRSNDSTLLQAGLRFKNEIVARRKRCRKLDPMPVAMTRYQGLLNVSGNQTSSGDIGLEVPDEQQLERLRAGLQQTNSKQQRDADRLKNEIQWIHGHFPVLKLANAKCSRTLRHQLVRNAVVHVSINFMVRNALLFWYNKLLDAQRKERLQLSASRQLIAMFERVSFERIADKFDTWRQWVLECQTQENMAAAVTLQRFARFIQSRQEERESAEQQVALMQALQELSRNAKTIQRAYRRHRRAVQQHRCEAAARKIQHIEMRRTAYNGFVKRQNAVKLIQKTYRAHSKQRSRKRAKAIADRFDRSREKNARRIQDAWLAYRSWRNCDLPVEVVQALVDQVEYLDAVQVIQRHLRGFQCRFKIWKSNNSAARIQKCWRAGKCRVTSRAERRMMHLRRDMAASCLQRTFRRTREERKIRCVLRQYTRPLYLRARYLGDDFREHFRLPIAKIAIVVIQTTWRRHVAYENEIQRKHVTATTIQRFLKRGVILSKWRISVFGAPRHHRNEAARILQRWIRRLYNGQSYSPCNNTSVVYLLEQISAATKIQWWYRHRRCDLWRLVLARLLTKELPSCIDAVNRIARCWKVYCARKREHIHRASVIADLIERQRRAEIENHAVRIIQRMFKRMIDRRDGRLLLRRYKILFRQEIKRQQQRVIVHKYLEEKSHQRKAKAASVAPRRLSLKTSMESPQMLSLDSNLTEVSAFPLDEIPYASNEGEWPEQSTEGPVQYWSEEYQRAYLYDPATGVSTWL